MPLFAELTPEEIVGTEAQVQARHYHARELIYRFHEDAASLFVLASGAAKLIRPSTHGQNIVMNILGAGEGFGALTVLA